MKAAKAAGAITSFDLNYRAKLWNIVGGHERAELAEKLAATDTLPNGAKQGLNDFKRTGYGGPCPPPGEAHRYFFKLYALDTATALKPRASKADLLHAMQGHVLAQGELMGTYQRAK